LEAMNHRVSLEVSQFPGWLNYSTPLSDAMGR
jgi:hypothetical protein